MFEKILAVRPYLALAKALAALFLIPLFPSPGQSKTIDLLLNGQDIQLLGTAANDYTGQAVVFSDINGDGRDDIAIAAPGFDYQGRSNCGIIYLILANDALPAVIDLSASESYIKRIIGPSATQNVGAVLSAGDINGDNVDDIVWGLPWASPSGRFFAGEVFVIFGGALPDTLDLASSPAGTSVIYGAAVFDKLGSSLATGNIDNDTCDDIVIGAPLASPPTGSSAGELFILYGSASFPPVIDLAGIAAGVTRVFGQHAADTFGNSCFLADLNGDNFDDIIAGAPMASPLSRQTAGAAYIIYGNSSMPETLDVSATLTGITRLFGAFGGDLTGTAVSSGDLTGNGVPEVIISAVDYSPPGRNQAGGVYVITGFPSVPDTIDLAASPQGITLIFGHETGAHIGMALAAGDLNSDGRKDVVIGAPQASPDTRTGAGEVLILFGRQVFPPAIDLSIPQTGLTMILGAVAGDYTGGALSTGDHNQDTFDDLLIGSRTAAVSSQPATGIVSIITGDPTITPVQLASYSAAFGDQGVSIWFEVVNPVAPSSFSVLRIEKGGTQVTLDGVVTEEGPGRYQFVDSDVAPGKEYTYIVFFDDEGRQLFTVSITTPAPGTLALHQSYPNPFASTAAIPFSLPEAGRPRIRIYDVKGALVAQLPTISFGPGRNVVEWTGMDLRGNPLPSGVYFVRLEFKEKRVQRKIVLIR